MNALYRISIAILVLLACGSPLRAQQTPPPPPWTGSLGAGLSLTQGNSDTLNFNFSFDLKHDPQTKNIFKFSTLYLRGEQNDEKTVDRFAINARDEYQLSDRLFVYGDFLYYRDPFKEVDYLIAPTAGLGYRVYKTDRVNFNVNGGVGGVWEKNTGLDVGTSGSVSAGEDLVVQLSDTARLTEKLTMLWKMDDFSDYHLGFSIGIATTIYKSIELKAEFNDTYKNKPTSADVEKNDIAFLTSVVYKF